MAYRSTQVSVRDFRAKLKLYCEGDEPVLLGNACYVKAIVIPVQKHWWHDEAAKRKALAEARKRWVKAVALAWPD